MSKPRAGGREATEQASEPVSVIFTSRDPRPLPHVPGALKLAQAAREAGWWVRTGVALAVHPDRYRANGELAKRAHVLETVGVYFRRPGERGSAWWTRTDGAGWRFDGAVVNLRCYGWSAAKTSKIPTILERVRDERIENHD